MTIGISPDDAAERVQHRLAALDEMTEIGLGLLRKLAADEAGADEARPDEAHSGTRDLGLTYARIARAVRMTVALADLLEQPAELRWAHRRGGQKAGEQKLGEQKPAAGAPAEPTLDERLREDDLAIGEFHALMVASVVEQAIEIEVEGDIGGPRAAELLGALYERFEDEDELIEIGSRSTGENVALICKDLGLTPDWALWRNEAWARQEAKDKTEGSPYGRPRRHWARPEGMDQDRGPPPPPGVRRAAAPLDTASGSP